LEAKICIGSDRILSRKETARFPEIGKLKRLTRDGIAPE
jgi:predicted Rdx family selenoprotein